MSWTKENIVIVILFILHAVGGLALSFESLKPLFLSLTPMNLTLSFLLLVWANNDFSFNFVKVISFLFIIGYLVEVLGVYSGVLFGEYE